MLKNDLRDQLLEDSNNYDYKAFVNYLISIKDTYNLAWADIAHLCNTAYSVTHDESYYRKRRYDKSKPSPNPSDQYDLNESLMALKKEKVKLSDERIQTRAYIRKLAREEDLKDIVSKAAKEVIANLPNYSLNNEFWNYLDVIDSSQGNEAILCLSDWHLGMECSNAWNQYNEQIAQKRVAQLRDKVIEKCFKNNVKTLYVLNLGDMIAGRIHEVIKLESREDVITQTMKVSELIAQLLDALSKHLNIEYYSCIDNHSNLEPSKDDRVESESLARITDWYLQVRCPQIHINTNKFGLDIITFSVNGFNMLAIHGDKDRPEQVIDSISRMTEDHYDMICMAHRHHFSCDEKNRTIIVANSSLMGTDTYAKSRRLSANPSQNLIIVSKDNPCEAIYRILVK